RGPSDRDAGPGRHTVHLHRLFAGLDAQGRFQIPVHSVGLGSGLRDADLIPAVANAGGNYGYQPASRGPPGTWYGRGTRKLASKVRTRLRSLQGELPLRLDDGPESSRAGTRLHRPHDRLLAVADAWCR